MRAPRRAGWAAPASVRSGDLRRRPDHLGQPGIARSHPYLRPTAGWPDNGPLLAFSRAVARWSGATRPTFSPQRLAHRGLAGALPTAAADGAHHPQHRLPGRHRRRLAPAASARAAGTTMVGRHQPAGGRHRPRRAVVAVLATYARRSSRPERLRPRGLLRKRWAGLVGILNGIDTRVGPGDRSAPRRATYDTAGELSGQGGEGGLAAVVAGRRRDPAGGDGHRLIDQKGVDLALASCPCSPRAAAPRRARRGDGASRRAGRAAADHPDTWRSSRLRRGLAHRLFGGGDLLLDAEPLRALRPGPDAGDALRHAPRGHRVGGLHDTVPDADRHGDGVFVADQVDASPCARRCSAGRLLADRRDGRLRCADHGPPTGRGSGPAEQSPRRAPIAARRTRRGPLGCAGDGRRTERAGDRPGRRRGQAAARRSPTTGPSRRCRSAAATA